MPDHAFSQLVKDAFQLADHMVLDDEPIRACLAPRGDACVVVQDPSAGDLLA